MGLARNILGGGLAVALLVGCAPPVLDRYMGRSIVDPMLDFGKPEAVFDLPDGRRAFQWDVTRQVTRPTPRPVVGVGIGIGHGGWGQVTTLGTSYETIDKTCLYTLIADRRGSQWVVSGRRRPAPGCA